MTTSKQLWVTKHNPDTMDSYIFTNPAHKTQFEGWIKEGITPHILLTGLPGSGKTSGGKMLLNELKIDPADVLFINASVENGVDLIRNKVTNFASCMPFGEYRYVFLDECDAMSHEGQSALRGTMEKYDNTCRFILTGNYSNKIIPALHSRCQHISFDKLDKKEFTTRVVKILISENVEITDIEVVDEIVNAAFPDMRKCINLLQQNSLTGTLTAPSSADNSTDDFKISMIAMFRSKDFKEARKMICSQITLEEYDGVYRFFYENLDFWATDAESEAEAIIIIRNGICKHAIAGDPEINLAATLCELELLVKE